MADEQVLLIADIVEAYIQGAGKEFKEYAMHLDLFKVCLMEIAYEFSNYNFDIQLQILKSFDRLGLSASYSEAYESLGIKGVQLESLGYLLARNSINWVQFNL